MTEILPIDYDQHWSESVETYANHPTSRHRRRFVFREMGRCGVHRDSFIFDYGCGVGLILEEMMRRFHLSPEQVGGSDISKVGVEAARARTGSPYLFHEEFPKLPKPIDVAVCTEVIEHIEDYQEVLRWLHKNLKSGGHLILTTPGVPMDPPDEFYGHLRHYKLTQLIAELQSIGFEVDVGRLWGFPFFSLQKWITKTHFDRIREDFMSGELGIKKKMIFNIAYVVYYVHDLIDSGPQIFIRATRR